MSQVTEGFKIVFKGEAEGLKKASAESAASIAAVIKAANKIGNVDSFKGLTQSASKAVSNINAITGNLQKLKIEYAMPNLTPIQRAFVSLRNDIQASFLAEYPAPSTARFTKSYSNAIYGAIDLLDTLRNTRVNMGAIQPPDLGLLKSAVEKAKADLSKATLIKFPPLPQVQPVHIPPVEKSAFDKSANQVRATVASISKTMAATQLQPFNIPTPIPPNINLVKGWVADIKASIASLHSMPAASIDAPILKPINTNAFRTSAESVLTQTERIHTQLRQLSTQPITPALNANTFNANVNAVIGRTSVLHEQLKGLNTQVAAPRIAPIDNVPFVQSADEIKARTLAIQSLLNQFGKTSVKAPTLEPIDFSQVQSDTNAAKANLSRIWGAPLVAPKVDFKLPPIPQIPAIPLPPIDASKYLAEMKAAIAAVRQEAGKGISFSKLTIPEIPSPYDKVMQGADEARKRSEQLQQAVANIGRLKGQTINFGVQPVIGKPDFSQLNRAIEVAKKNASNAFLIKMPDIKDPFQKVVKGGREAQQTIFNVGRVIQDAPWAVMAGNIGAIANNIDPLTESFARLKREAGGSWLKALGGALAGPAGVGIAISAVTSTLVLFGDRLFKTTSAADKLRESQERIKKTTEEFLQSLNHVVQARIESEKAAQNELISAELLYKASQDQNRSLTERQKAVDALQQQYPSYFKNVKDETILAGGATAAYNALRTSILNVAKAQALKGRLVKLADEEIDVNEQGKAAAAEFIRAAESRRAVEQDIAKLTGAELAKESTALTIQRRMNAAVEAESAARAKLNGLGNQALAIAKKQIDYYNQLNALPVDSIISAVTAGGNKAAEALPKGQFDFFNDFFKFDPNKAKLTEKQIADLLKAANSFAKEYGQMLEGLDFNQPTQEGALKAARQWWKDYTEGIVRMKPQSIPIDFSFVPAVVPDSGNIARFIEGIKQGFAKGIGVPIQINQFDINAYNLQKEVGKSFEEIGRKMPAMKIPAPTMEGLDQWKAQQMEIISIMQAQHQLVNQSLNPAFTELFSAIMSGGNALESFSQALGNSLKQLIAQLAATAAVAGLIALVTGGGFSAIAGSLNPLFKAFAKMPGLASGGIMNPYGTPGLDRYPVMLSAREAVVPLDKLDRYINTGNSSQPQGVQRVRIRGNDLMLTTARTTRQQRRLT